MATGVAAPMGPEGLGTRLIERLRALEMTLNAPAGDATVSERQRALLGLAELSEVITAATGQFLSASDGAGDHLRDGARSLPSWLTKRSELDRPRAAAMLKTANTLRSLPGLRAAQLDGRLGHAKVQAALRARIGVEERFARDEDLLVDTIAPLTVDHARIALARWRELALSELPTSPDDPPPDDPGLNEVRLRPGFDGSTHLDGTFGLLAGAEIRALLQSEIDRGIADGTYRPDDGMTFRQRLADATLRLLRRGANNPDGSSSPRREIVVLVDLADLLGIPSSRLDEITQRIRNLTDGTPVPLAVIEDMLGDTSISMFLGTLGLQGRFRPLGEVTTQRLATRRQRCELRARDRGCRWPGCDQDATWCRAHHEPAWERTHHTTTNELLLLCPFHHRLRHHGNFDFHLNADGTVTVLSPDGAPLPNPPRGCKIDLPPDLRTTPTNERPVSPPTPPTTVDARPNRRPRSVDTTTSDRRRTDQRTRPQHGPPPECNN